MGFIAQFRIRTVVVMTSKEKSLRGMQWFILIFFALCMLASIGASVVVLIATKNPLTLSISLIPTPLLLAMRPIIRYLFPQEQPSEKQVP